jgi:hypothetical protein
MALPNRCSCCSLATVPSCLQRHSGTKASSHERWTRGFPEIKGIGRQRPLWRDLGLVTDPAVLAFLLLHQCTRSCSTHLHFTTLPSPLHACFYSFHRIRAHRSLPDPSSRGFLPSWSRYPSTGKSCKLLLTCIRRIHSELHLLSNLIQDPIVSP